MRRNYTFEYIQIKKKIDIGRGFILSAWNYTEEIKNSSLDFSDHRRTLSDLSLYYR